MKVGRNSVLTPSLGGPESYPGMDGGDGSCDEEHRVNWVEKETGLGRKVGRPWVQRGKEAGRWIKGGRKREGGTVQQRQRGGTGIGGNGGRRAGGGDGWDRCEV